MVSTKFFTTLLVCSSLSLVYGCISSKQLAQTNNLIQQKVKEEDRKHLPDRFGKQWWQLDKVDEDIKEKSTPVDSNSAAQCGYSKYTVTNLVNKKASFIVGGVNALQNEYDCYILNFAFSDGFIFNRFPWLVKLSVRDTSDGERYLCAASIISE